MNLITKIQPLILLLICSLFVTQATYALPQNIQIQEAAEQLTLAQRLDKESRQHFLKANKIRKQLKNLRANKSKHSNGEDDPENEISMLVKALEVAQQQGATTRAQSEQLKKAATTNFTKGVISVWGNWITNTRPLTMDSNVENFFAHNSRVRSVHNNMPKVSLSDEIVTADRNDMSLKVPVLIGQNAPPGLDIGAFKLSRQERLFAHIEVHTDPQIETTDSPTQSNNVTAVPLNSIHQWRLLVTDLQGKPVENIQFLVEGHMPGHVHGLPTEPRVIKEIEPGIYIVDGLKFQMKGWWVMKFIIADNETNATDKTQSDFFTFNLVL
ncbi:FixH family protein [Aliikangiella marina]|nr:FixH family protein [Aliikangiella marina]